MPHPATRALPATAFPPTMPSTWALPSPATAPHTTTPRASTPPALPLAQGAVTMGWEKRTPVPAAGLGAVSGEGDCREPGYKSPQLQELIQVVRELRGDLRALVHTQRQERRQLGAIAGSLAELAGAVRQLVGELPSQVLRGQSQLPAPAWRRQGPAPPTDSLA
ncbi:hypothetical protein G0U57_013787 [Chelydra serpentina]|uniref:Uncharacterized protein n=1 Tax=Chelydra serpentina TaxID=8475 RepID=A0A8T1RW71_CHESE|nr:hypothetical protein G0U57_013787 [Chelydra serpentina]